MTAAARRVFIGTDGGATTTKIGAVWADGSPVSTRVLQRTTNSEDGPMALMSTWADSVGEYLAEHNLTWDDVAGVGAAMPGPQARYGVLERGPNLPASFSGFDLLTAYSQTLAQRAGREIPVVVGNDGNMGGVAEAQRARGDSRASVLMLAPGSGLGTAFVDQNGLPLDGDTLAGMEAAHMPAPLHLLGVPAFPCGCGRTWGCIEAYTTLSGLPYLLEARLPKFPDHPLNQSTEPMKKRVLALRGLAQRGDALAQDIFDFQARAMGLLVASLAMALDPEFVVIGGGLMDLETTTPEFRERYLSLVFETARPYLWPAQQSRMKVRAAVLGELSQAIGAALVALYRSRE